MRYKIFIPANLVKALEYYKESIEIKEGAATVSKHIPLKSIEMLKTSSNVDLYIT